MDKKKMHNLNREFLTRAADALPVMEGKKMKILFLIGLLLLGGLYLYFLETWRIGCALLWFMIPAYCLAGVVILEK